MLQVGAGDLLDAEIDPRPGDGDEQDDHQAEDQQDAAFLVAGK